MGGFYMAISLIIKITKYLGYESAFKIVFSQWFITSSSNKAEGQATFVLYLHKLDRLS